MHSCRNRNRWQPQVCSLRRKLNVGQTGRAGKSVFRVRPGLPAKIGKGPGIFYMPCKKIYTPCKIFTCLVNIFTQTQKNPVKYPVANKHNKNVPHVLAQGGSTCHTRPASGNRKKRKIIHCPCWRHRLPMASRRRQTLSSGRHWSRGVRTRRRHTGGWRLRGRAARSAVRPLHPVCGLRP